MDVTKVVALTDNEVRVLLLLLSVDLDALGMERKDQGPARTVAKKLKGLS